jgi:hypothetical protein
MDLNGIKPAPQPQPEPLVFTGEVNKFYSTVRNGRKVSIYVTQVKKDTVTYKDKPEDKHASTMPLAKFLKFYK